MREALGEGYNFYIRAVSAGYHGAYTCFWISVGLQDIMFPFRLRIFDNISKKAYTVVKTILDHLGAPNFQL